MPSGTQQLEAFTREALLRGLSKTDIENALIEAGWTREQARSNLDAYADVPFPVPVPRPRAFLSAREAFLYLLLFTTLYLSAYHLGSLCFHFVDGAFPDPALESPDRNSLARMRWSAASLIVAFPVFLLVSFYIQRSITRSPLERLSPIRRWLTYLTLFLGAAILIGDLTTLVYSLLGGELTIRFVLKILIVGLIAGTIFGYYLSDLRREERE